MPIPSPNLDDRNFADLVEEARRLIAQKSPNWTDLSPGDPGIVLVELFAHLTDVMLYRLNRVPDKAYHEFLRMIGVRLHPPSAATTMLRFKRTTTGGAIAIPQGTRVTVSRGGAGGTAPVFVTTAPVSVAADGKEVDVLGIDCDVIDGESAGVGTGRPGLWLTLARPPVIAATEGGLDLVVGVEATAADLGERAAARRFNGKDYRIWREVDHFTDSGPDDLVYVADRLEGTIIFAPAARLTQPGGSGADSEPAALAGVPAAGREIMVWYRRGGGPQGNLPANSLTTMKDQITGVEVTNPAAATGGRAAESLENALIRGPQELHSLSRAVTARDYELNATSVGAVARARAVTRAAYWTFASPGTVEVILVPEVPPEQRPEGLVSAAALASQETEEARSQVQTLLDERRPLGTSCLVSWGRYKPVKVQARLHVRREEDATRVRQRVLSALYDAVNPLATPTNNGGWEFGQPLRVSDIFYVSQREPGVRWIDNVRLIVDMVPDANVTHLSSDPSQPGMWYASSGSNLFSSRNDGSGWELTKSFPDEQVLMAEPDPNTAGRLAVVTRLGDKTSRLYLSTDCGQTWATSTRALQFGVNDLAWIGRDDVMYLLLASDKGLYELPLEADASPVQVLVDVRDASRPLYSVAAAIVSEVACVATAVQGEGGVFFSRSGGRTNTFRSIGLEHVDVRVLTVQRDGPRAFLWAGVAVESPTDPGSGCHSWTLGAQDPVEGWVAHKKGFEAAGSCRDLAFQGEKIFAATHHGGVMWLDSRADDAIWHMPDVNSGLPLRDPSRFHPVDAVAANPDGRVLMAGGIKGIVSSRDAGVSYQLSSRREFTIEDVTIPPTWLVCSDVHDLEVASE